MADADLIQSRKDDLQKWLKARGLKTTGRKRELIDRVLKAKQNGIETTAERETREKEQQEKRAAEKLQTPSEILPNPKTLNNWSQDLSKLPRITYTEIKNYLVYGSCKFYKSEDMRCFKQLKAFKFFKDGHVQEISLTEVSSVTRVATVSSNPRYCHQCAKTEFTVRGLQLLKKQERCSQQIVTALQGM